MWAFSKFYMYRGGYVTATEIKDRTNELYDSLPQEEEERRARIDVRNEVIELNYDFFKFVASHTFPVGKYFSFEDKLNSGILYFCNSIWHKYRWEGHSRMDLCFSTYFYPRVSKGLYQELSEIKYTPKRNVLSKISEQLGKPWSEIRKEDLSNPELKLSADSRRFAETIFEVPNTKSLDDVSIYLSTSPKDVSITDSLTDAYDSVEELLVHEMIINEKKLSNAYLQRLSEMFCIDLDELISVRPVAEEILLERLRESQFLKDTFQ